MMKQLLLILASTLLILHPGLAQEKIGVEQKQAKSGYHYTLLLKKQTAIHFTTTRPKPSDKKIQLCIPAAFSLPDNKGLDGIYAVNGVVHNKDSVNSHLGGILLIEKGTLSMLNAKHGATFTGTFLQKAKLNGCSFFQQIWCIENGKAASFKDVKLFQRRGIALMSDGSVAVIESLEAITLKAFSEDLVELGVVNLMYTDMGSFDEGWYRDPKQSGKIIPIGRNRASTAYQTNWITFEN